MKFEIEGETLSPLEKFWLRRLRRLPRPVFEEIVKRLVDGESVYSVCRWLEDLNPPGVDSMKAQGWKRYIRAVRLCIQDEIQAHQENAVPTLAAVERTIEKFDKSKQVLVPGVDVPDPRQYKKMQRVVYDAIQNLEAGTLVRYAYMLQLERVDRTMALEAQINMNVKDGHRDMDILCKLAAEAVKLEIAGKMIQIKGGMTFADLKSVNANAKNEAATLSGAVADRIARMNEVDRNLIRAATQKLKNLIIEDAHGHITIEGLAAKQDRPIEAEVRGNERSSGPDESGSA